MFFANLLLTIGIVIEVAFLVLLGWRRTYRSLPVFFFYIFWGVVGDVVVLISRTLLPFRTLYPFEVTTYIDLGFQYLVLIELGWSTLRPIQRSLPKGVLFGISLIIAAAAVAAWPLAGVKELSDYPRHLLFAFQIQRIFAILRIVFFLALACCSQLLGLSWRDRELQVVTGLGIYSFVSIAGTIVHLHQSSGWQYFWVDTAVACSYLISLVYWIYSFAQKEPARCEITPEMRRVLRGVSDVIRVQQAWLRSQRITEPPS